MKKAKIDLKRQSTFITIFPPVENIHLVKDVGMYPYAMHQYCDYDSSIITNKRLKYPYLDSEVQGLKGINAPSVFQNQEYNCILWLLLNARKIDVLNLFHQVKHTRVSIAIYMLFNWKGKVYVHLDCDGTQYSDYQLGLEGKSIKRGIKRFVYYHIFYPKRIRKNIIWGVQNKQAERNIVGKFPYENVKYMPNGYILKYKEHVTYTEKENIIITVGRIGTQQKRTDVLLKGFVKVHTQFLEPWKLKVIGPIETEFKDEIDAFYKEYPGLEDKIEFTGAIYDRKQLIQEYNKAKIFCLTSDYESFGIVLVEAMARGCTILSSDFPAASDLIDNEKNGKTFERGNVTEFASKLLDISNDTNYMEKCCENSQRFVQENYTYDHIMKILENELKQF